MMPGKTAAAFLLAWASLASALPAPPPTPTAIVLDPQTSRDYRKFLKLWVADEEVDAFGFVQEELPPPRRRALLKVLSSTRALKLGCLTAVSLAMDGNLEDAIPLYGELIARHPSMP